MIVVSPELYPYAKLAHACLIRGVITRAEWKQAEAVQMAIDRSKHRDPNRILAQVPR